MFKCVFGTLAVTECSAYCILQYWHCACIPLLSTVAMILSVNSDIMKKSKREQFCVTE